MIKVSIGLVFFCTLFIHHLNAQVGIINDPDGYTNVRVDSNINAAVCYKIKESEVFFIDHEYLKMDSEWILVWVDNNINLPMINIKVPERGFVHRSRILQLQELPKYEKNDVQLVFNITKADTTEGLDPNIFYHGLDIPLYLSYRVSSLRLNWKGEKVELDKKYYQDLYNVFFEEGSFSSQNDKFSFYRNEDTYYIFHNAADGAGFYHVVWVIKDGKVIQRLAGSTI